MGWHCPAVLVGQGPSSSCFFRSRRGSPFPSHLCPYCLTPIQFPHDVTLPRAASDFIFIPGLDCKHQAHLCGDLPLELPGQCTVNRIISMFSSPPSKALFIEFLLCARHLGHWSCSSVCKEKQQQQRSLLLCVLHSRRRQMIRDE